MPSPRSDAGQAFGPLACRFAEPGAEAETELGHDPADLELEKGSALLVRRRERAQAFLHRRSGAAA